MSDKLGFSGKTEYNPQRDTISKSELVNHLNESAYEMHKHNQNTSAGILLMLRDEIMSGRFDTPELPLANEDESKSGWTLSYDYMEQIENKLEGYMYLPSLETIELVLLAHHNMPLPEPDEEEIE